MVFGDVRFDFTGRRALVVGGSRGIGLALVRAFVEAGADTIYAARRPADDDPGATFVAADLTDPRSIEALFARLDEGGGLDVLVNATAINYAHQISDVTLEEWDEVIAVNLRAAFVLCREAAARMRGAGSGRIVNVASIAGRHRSPVSGVHYVASKAGLIGLTRQLAFELGPHGVTVNAVCPSQTMTEMLTRTMTEDQQADLAASIPLRRLATVEEQVGPILFLCSDAAAYMHGAVVDVNGGQI